MSFVFYFYFKYVVTVLFDNLSKALWAINDKLLNNKYEFVNVKLAYKTLSFHLKLYKFLLQCMYVFLYICIYV